MHIGEFCGKIQCLGYVLKYCSTSPGSLGGSDRKNLPASTGDPGSILWLGGSPGKGNGHTLQYSCLENPMDRGDWWATVHGVEELDTTEQLTHTLSTSPRKGRLAKCW